MRWFDIIREKLNPAQSNIVDDFGKDHYPSSNIYSNQKAYNSIPVVNRGINLIVDSGSEINYDIMDSLSYHRSETKIRAKKIAELLNFNPNPYYNADVFRRNILQDLLVEGNAYIYFDGAFLYNLPASNVKIITSRTTHIDYYEYADEKFLSHEIIHIMENSCDSVFRGRSRMDSMKDTLSLLLSMHSYQKTFFDNSAITGIVIQTPNPLSERIKERIITKWMQDYNPKRGGKRPMILDGDFKVVPLSQTSFQEMDFIESTKSIETTVLKTLGVPPLLLDAGNNANINPNLRMFYINTVMPLINKITMGFETFFGYDIKPVTQDVLALRPDLRELGAFHTSLVNAGIFTVNESRVDLRREKFKDPKADEMRIPANIAGSAVDPNEGGRPSEENEDE